MQAVLPYREQSWKTSSLKLYLVPHYLWLVTLIPPGFPHFPLSVATQPHLHHSPPWSSSHSLPDSKDECVHRMVRPSHGSWWPCMRVWPSLSTTNRGRSWSLWSSSGQVRVTSWQSHLYSSFHYAWTGKAKNWSVDLIKFIISHLKYGTLLIWVRKLMFILENWGANDLLVSRYYWYNSLEYVPAQLSNFYFIRTDFKKVVHCVWKPKWSLHNGDGVFFTLPSTIATHMYKQTNRSPQPPTSTNRSSQLPTSSNRSPRLCTTVLLTSQHGYPLLLVLSLLPSGNHLPSYPLQPCTSVDYHHHRGSPVNRWTWASTPGWLGWP